jgi:cbb3-type cytochrome oxidase maturation protein
MNILFVLVPVALMLAALGVAGFIWSVRSGQFDDLETPGMRVLFGDESRTDGQRTSQKTPEERKEAHRQD